MHTRIKICGITRPTDATAAVYAGADALGFVFYPPSSRYIQPALARDICRQLPPFVTTVGLFLDEEVGRVREVAALVGLDVLQFHGNETPEECRAAGYPYIKAVGMRGLSDPIDYACQYEEARGFLLDSHSPGTAGGTGQTFDWGRIPTNFPKPIILAGGLNPDNVCDAIQRVRPYAVDVSSGVEAAPGHKDSDLIMRFISEVRRGDAQ